MNKQAEKLEELLNKYPALKGDFIGFKCDRGGMGVSRIDDDWYECDQYYINVDDLSEFLESRLTAMEKVVEALDDLLDTYKRRRAGFSLDTEEEIIRIETAEVAIDTYRKGA